MIYLVMMLSLIAILYLTTIIALLRAKITLWKMHTDLEEWINIGIGMDIVRSKEHRPEFKPYVDRFEKDESKRHNIPKYTVLAIREDLKHMGLFSPIYYHLLRLYFKDLFK